MKLKNNLEEQFEYNLYAILRKIILEKNKVLKTHAQKQSYSKSYSEIDSPDSKQNVKNILSQSSLLIALSGGADSVALLSLCNKVRNKYNMPKIAAAYVNHGLQAKEEQEKERNTVERVCAQLDITLYSNTENLSHSILDKEKQHINEETARNFRYEFLQRIAHQHDYQYIVFAHHLDDVYETILMRLLEARGIQGLSAIPMYRKIKSPSADKSLASGELYIIRPLIVEQSLFSDEEYLVSNQQKLRGIFRDELMEEIKKEELDFHQDISNKGLDFQRNIIRNSIIPRLEKEYGVSQEGLFRFSHHLQNILRNTNKQIESQVPIFKSANNSIRLSKIYFFRLQKFEKIILLYRIYNMLQVREVKEEFLDAILEHVFKNDVEFHKREVRCSIKGEYLIFSKISSSKKEQENALVDIDCNLDGSAKKIDDDFFLKYNLLCRGEVYIKKTSKKDYIQKDGQKINIRSFLTKKKPNIQWQEIPLVCDEEGVVCVAGDTLLAPTLVRSLIRSKDISISSEYYAEDYDSYILYLTFQKLILRKNK